MFPRYRKISLQLVNGTRLHDVSRDCWQSSMKTFLLVVEAHLAISHRAQRNENRFGEHAAASMIQHLVSTES